MNLTLIWSMLIDRAIRDANISIFSSPRASRSTDATKWLIREASRRSVRVFMGGSRVIPEGGRKCICELTSYRDSRIDRFTVLMANTCLVCVPHRIPARPPSFHRSFLSIPHFFFRSRSPFHPFAVVLPCPVTMIDRLCQDRAASAAHREIPWSAKWRVGSGAKLTRFMPAGASAKVSHAGINRSSPGPHVRVI